jgi:hypothetical protein
MNQTKAKQSASSRSLFAAAATIGLALGGVATVGLVNGAWAASAPGEAPPSTWPTVRAAGLDPAAAKPALTLKDGTVVSVVSNAKTRCLVYSDGTDSCRTAIEVNGGLSWHVENDCSTAGGAMSVSGSTPDGATAAQLVYSDGTTATGTVSGGVYAFAAQTPGATDRTPTALTFTGGGTGVSTPFPLARTQFCPAG